jgi:hypothetical protein
MAATVESQLRLQANHLQRIICNKGTVSGDYFLRKQVTLAPLLNTKFDIWLQTYTVRRYYVTAPFLSTKSD